MQNRIFGQILGIRVSGLHSGDTNYVNHAQIRYIYAIKHSPSGATCPPVHTHVCNCT